MKLLSRYWMVLVPFCVFGLLLCRNPYSQRTQIANLEPYPDSIHYLNPALGLLHGQGLYINRGGRKLLPGVPPLYSLVLILGFIFNQDVRTFYLLNVGLALLAFGLFYLILRKIVSNQFFIFILLCLYVTNYTLYWFPELAMAENLILPLALGAIYLLILPTNRRHAMLAGIVAVCFYATKFASLPLSVAVTLLYGLKLILGTGKVRVQSGLSFVCSLSISGAIYVWYEFAVRHNDLIGGLLGLFWALFAPRHVLQAVAGGPQAGGFFSLQYIGMNLNAYGHWLMGAPLYILWKPITILPRYLIGIGWLGVVGSLFTRKRNLSLLMCGLLVFNLLFMMTFYVADGRYVVIAIPILILNVGLAFAYVHDQCRGVVRRLANLILLGLCCFYLVTTMGRLKFDVMLNLRHTESPWYYISVTTFDTYLKDHVQEFSKEPVVISALPPYLVDFYATQKFMLLPLTPGQEFSTHKIEAWGNYDYDNLPQVFATFFQSGHPVFLTGYGLGNEQYKHEAFDALMTEFAFKKVADGCYSLCNVYQMTSLTSLPPLASVHNKL